MKLSKEDILSQASSPKVESVEVPEMGGHLYIRVMSGHDRNAFEVGLDRSLGGSHKNVHGRLASLCLCDENGDRLFDDSDADALGNLSGLALQTIFEAACRLNRIGDSQTEQAVGE